MENKSWIRQNTQEPA